MDIYEYLKLDHQHVDKLFKKFSATESSLRKIQVMTLIARELLVHAHSEQETFYKILKNFDLTQKEALHAQSEHKEIEDLIKIILSSKVHGRAWTDKVIKLKDIVTHHVREEEGPIFRHAKKVLSEEDALVLKEQMHYLKQQMLLSLQKDKSVKSESKKKKTPPSSRKILKKSEEHRPRVH